MNSDTYFVSISDDTTARIWDMSSRKEKVVLRGHKDALTDVAFSPDGNRVATASSDSTVRIWDLEPPYIDPTWDLDRLMALAQDYVTRELTDEEKAIYLNFTESNR
ncbi:MAG: hypothetical protein HC828_18920 [Blastochloris sp.]|nr:hypothetical protein [Blastochloris sp.]